MTKSKLIIRGPGAGEVLYRGDGQLEQWQEKLGGKLEEPTYYVTQIKKIPGEELLTTNECFIMNPTDGQYYSIGVNQTLYPLDRQSKDLLLELINSVPEQGK